MTRSVVDDPAREQQAEQRQCNLVASDRRGDGWAEVAGLSAKADHKEIVTGLTARRRLARAA